jgi:hypothetical protein
MPLPLYGGGIKITATMIIVNLKNLQALKGI